MKVVKKVALAFLLSICITRGVNAEAHEDPAYIYAPITANGNIENGYKTYDLGVPVMVNEEHSKIVVQVSSSRSFACDDKTNTFATPSEGKIYVYMGRWIAYEPESENLLYCRVGYYTPDGKWAGWAASCAIYY